MSDSDQNGFTIIEVLLFLAVSAFFIIIALRGIGGKTDDVRYGQSLKDLEVLFQSEQDLVRNGYIGEVADIDMVAMGCDGADGRCVGLGRVLAFSAGSSDVRIYSLLGNRIDGLGNSIQRLEDANLRIVEYTSGANYETKQLEWQQTFQIGKFTSYAADTDINAVGYFRLPNSTEIFPIAFRGGGNIESIVEDADSYSTSTVSADSSFARLFSFDGCFETLDGRFTRLSLGEEGRINAIDVYADQASGCGL